MDFKLAKLGKMDMMKGLLAMHFQKKVVTPRKIITPPPPPPPVKPKDSDRSPRVYEREMREFPNEFVDELHENE